MKPKRQDKLCGQCDRLAVYCDGTHSYCTMHRRILRMLSNARRDGKHAPTVAEMEAMFAVLVDMRCPHCKRVMGMHKDELGLPLVVSIQHWRDGRVSLLCLSCNVRHGHMGEDRFLLCDAESKSCACCKRVLPLDAFGPGAHFAGRRSSCRECERNRSKKQVCGVTKGSER